MHGELKASGGKEQATEVHAAEVIVHGWADPEAYPLQKKRHSFEKLREWAHLRPRTNTFGAIARVRNQVCQSIHQFFQEQGFLYIHPPIITASDCEGAGEMFKVSTLNLNQVSKQNNEIDYSQDFFGKPACTTPGAARLAMLTKAPIFPVFLVREDESARHRIEILPEVEMTCSRTGCTSTKHLGGHPSSL